MEQQRAPRREDPAEAESTEGALRRTPRLSAQQFADIREIAIRQLDIWLASRFGEPEDDSLAEDATDNTAFTAVEAASNDADEAGPPNNPADTPEPEALPEYRSISETGESPTLEATETSSEASEIASESALPTELLRRILELDPQASRAELLQLCESPEEEAALRREWAISAAEQRQLTAPLARAAQDTESAQAECEPERAEGTPDDSQDRRTESPDYAESFRNPDREQPAIDWNSLVETDGLVVPEVRTLEIPRPDELSRIWRIIEEAENEPDSESEEEAEEQPQAAVPPARPQAAVPPLPRRPPVFPWGIKER